MYSKAASPLAVTGGGKLRPGSVEQMPVGPHDLLVEDGEWSRPVARVGGQSVQFGKGAVADGDEVGVLLHRTLIDLFILGINTVVRLDDDIDIEINIAQIRGVWREQWIWHHDITIATGESLFLGI